MQPRGGTCGSCHRAHATPDRETEPGTASSVSVRSGLEQNPSVPWWLLILHRQREDWCREISFQPLLLGDGGILCWLCFLPRVTSFQQRGGQEGSGWERLLCCSVGRRGLHKPSPSLPQHSQAGLGGPERGASSCKHAWAGGSCLILTEAALCPRNSLRAFVLDKHLTCSRALSTAWISGMHCVTTALPHQGVTCRCSVQGGVSTGHCSIPKCRQYALCVVQRQVRKIPAPSSGSYCLVNTMKTL